MKKEIKFISTLALAGMMATSSLPGIVSAATSDTSTRCLGIYRESLAQKMAVPFVLANKNDQVTMKDLKDSGKFTTVTVQGSVPADDYVLKTGDTFVGDGETYTVVVYGDVNKDGSLNVLDVTLAARAGAGNTTLTGADYVAANVNSDKAVNVLDVVTLARFAVGNSTTYVTEPAPEQEVQDPEVQNAYTITVNENNKITNLNANNLQVTLKVKEAVTSNTTLQLVVFDENGAQISKTSTVSGSTPGKNYVTTPLINVPGTVTLTKGTVAGKVQKIGSATINASQVPDGKIYFRLYAEDDEKLETPLAEQVVVKNTVAPEIAKVSVERDGIHRATFKGIRYGESDIQTVYYCAVSADNSGAPTWDAEEKVFGKVGSYTPVTRRINVNGSDSVQTTIEGLDDNKAYNVYYVLENAHGSQTKWSSPVGIAKDIQKSQVPEVDGDITFTVNTKKFTWNSSANYAYIVTLYKDSKIYHEEKRLISSGTTAEFELKNYVNNDASLEPGKYYIEVVRIGDPTNATNPRLNSEVVASSEVTVKAVSQVTDLTYTLDETTGNPKLTWKENDENCGGYTVNLYIQDPETGIMSKVITTYANTSVASNKSIYFSASTPYAFGDNWTINTATSTGTLWRNKDYKVEVIAKVGTIDEPEENTVYVASQPATLEVYAPYREATVVNATDSTMKFKLDLDTHKNYPYSAADFGYGKKEADYEYSMRVYDNAGKYIETKPVKIEYTYKDKAKTEVDETFFTVEGLGANTAYQFRLVTKCGDFEGWSEFISNVKTLPRINGLTVVATEDECTPKSRTIYLGKINDATGDNIIVVEGVSYKRSDLYDGPAKNNFIALKDFLANLKVGDEISIDANNISIGLNSTASDSADLLKVTFVKDKNVTIVASAEHERKLATTTGNEPAEVHLKGNKAQYDLKDLKLTEKGKITLEDTVYVKTATNPTNDFTVVAGADVTINNIGMSTSLDTTVKVENETTLVVVANGSANNLVFESRNDKVDASQVKDLTIKFVSANDEKAVQQGTIVIKGNVANSKVTVTQENVEVGSDITVTVEKGEVDVYGAKATGTAVTLSPKDDETTSITVTAATPAPAVLRGTALEIANYTSTRELRNAMTGDVSVGYYPSEEDLTAVNNWLKEFGINGKGASVSIDRADLSKVTITYAGTETLQVNGLK